MGLKSFAVTDKGLKRASNEDSYVATHPVYIVADGMGGHNAGEVAAEIVHNCFEQLLSRTVITKADVDEAIHLAVDEIRKEVYADKGKEAMGTTLCGLIYMDHSDQAGASTYWLVVNIGDSRAYRMANGTLKQLTIDHSEVDEMLVRGEITKEEAVRHPLRHIITRSIDQYGTHADFFELPTTPGARYLICTDGLTDDVNEAYIAEVLSKGASPDQTAKILLEGAIRAGGRDNITIIVIEEDKTTQLDDITEVTMPRKVVI